MYYIWFDESDKEGAFYSNFYGGILVDSKNYEKVIAMSKTGFNIGESTGISKIEERWTLPYSPLEF